MTLNSVVLPAPLGPIRPVTCPAATSRSTSRTALWPPKRTLAPRTSRRAMSGSFDPARPIPCAPPRRAQAVGLGSTLVQVAHQPEAQERGQSALQVEGDTGYGPGKDHHGQEPPGPLPQRVPGAGVQGVGPR